MTFAIGHVQGGTNAGRRVIKPTPQPWYCACENALRPGYLARCSECGDERDDETAYRNPPRG